MTSLPAPEPTAWRDRHQSHSRQVLDRQGRELARSIDTESFFADPREIENVDLTARTSRRRPDWIRLS